MLRHYLKTALRSLWKNNIFSLINIIGLAISMAACMLILEFVSFELSYDRFNKNFSEIYRVINDHYQNGRLIQHSSITYSAIGRAIRENCPEVINSARLVPFDQEIIISGANKIGEQKVLAVDASFLNIFSFPLLAGNPETALQEPHTVVISETLIRKLFVGTGTDYGRLLGKTLMMSGDSLPYKITGICRGAPANSHLQFDLLFSYQTIIQNGWTQANDDFSRTDFHTYVQLMHAVDYRKVDAKLTSFNRKYFREKMALGVDEKFYLQPLSKIHLYSDVEFEIGKTRSATVVWGLLVIAGLIIVIAWTNYINLATAKSAERAKEIGIKKVAGASRKQLILQFLTESFVINIVALIAAVFIVSLLQNRFNDLTQEHLSLSHLFQSTLNGYPITAALMLLIAIGIFISSFYPALVLSSFRPVLVLNGKFSASGKGIFLRKILVIGQFAITVVLIIGSIVVYRQVRFMNSQQLGMNIDQLLIVKNPSLTAWDSVYLSKANNFINALKQLPHVKDAAASWRIPGEEWPREAHVLRTAADANAPVAMRNIGVSKDFIQTYDIRLLAGRNFEETDYHSDWQKTRNVILSRSACRLLGFFSPTEIIGRTIIIENRPWEVVGIVEDFHQKSLHYPIEPTIMNPSLGTFCPFSIKIDIRNVASTIAAVEEKYNEFLPGNLFSYFFLRDQFNSQYRNDQLFGKIFAIFAGFAIFIGCLGLLGLSLLATTQRKKEIAVRKVLGASVSGIVMLLSKDFIRLIIISIIIALPFAWYILHNWLQNFAYRINISWWIFLSAGALAVFIALSTISVQTIKAALANPADNLRAQ